VSSPIQDYLDRLHHQLMPLQGGRVADYIPELAKADPADFGIAIATVDGRVYETGTTRKAFTIQSISKPLVYGVALEDQGPERVRQVVGVEPTGEAFNSISLEPGTGRPLEPDDQRRGHCHLVAGGRRHAAGPAGACDWTARCRPMPAGRWPSTRRCSNRNGPPATATAPSATCCATTTS
jgi:hypothetical protein